VALVIARVIAPWSVRRDDGSLAVASERLLLPASRAQRLAEQGVIAIVEAVG
jgi:hypothetical protein